MLFGLDGVKSWSYWFWLQYLISWWILFHIVIMKSHSRQFIRLSVCLGSIIAQNQKFWVISDIFWLLFQILILKILHKLLLDRMGCIHHQIVLFLDLIFIWFWIVKCFILLLLILFRSKRHIPLILDCLSAVIIMCAWRSWWTCENVAFVLVVNSYFHLFWDWEKYVFIFISKIKMNNLFRILWIK